MTGPLDGLNVVEVAQGVSGPYAGKLLADLGAEVIKVETPRAGDYYRYVPPFYKGQPSADSGLLFNFLNTSKLGITLDLDASGGRILFDLLVAQADVLLVSGKPSVIEERRLDFEAQSHLHPGLVCTYLSPFGLMGPRSDWEGGELVAFHMSGLGLATPRERFGPEPTRPLKGGSYQALMVAGLTAATATMHALFAREVDGESQCVDVSEVEPLACYQFLQVGRWTYAGDDGNRGYGEGSRRFWCKDGAVSMLLFTGQERQWDGFRELVGNPDWIQGYRPPISRIPDDDPFWAHLNVWAGQYTREELYRKAQGLRVPLFPENDVAEAVDSDQVQARGFIKEMTLATGDVVRGPTSAYTFSQTPAGPRSAAPSLGRDNALVLCERLGLSREELASASAAGVV